MLAEREVERRAINKEIRELSKRVSEKLTDASSVAVLTGAGISAESGVPTFRGEDGLWKRFRPEELADFDAFIKNPRLVQSWYAHRREIVEDVEPNAGHYALKALEDRVSDFMLITQNIDNLHQTAGSERVVELHGNIFKNYCIDCGKRYDGKEMGQVYRCECGGLIRPDVVWYGEFLPVEEHQKAERFCRRCSVLVSVGTSGVVHPAAALPFIAKENGAFLAEINPAPTDISFIMDVTLRQEAGTILPRIVENMK